MLNKVTLKDYKDPIFLLVIKVHEILINDFKNIINS